MTNLKELNQAVMEKHVLHLKWLEENQTLLECGPYTDSSGGMILLKSTSETEAIELAEMDPFISGNYMAYELKSIKRATKENNYLLS